MSNFDPKIIKLCTMKYKPDPEFVVVVVVNNEFRLGEKVIDRCFEDVVWWVSVK